LTKVEGLEKRLDSLEPKPEASDELEGKVRQAWIVTHLTEPEQLELARAIKRIDDLKPNIPSGQELTKHQGLLMIATERAKKDPEPDWLEFKEKWIRAGIIRHVQRVMTEAEHDELNILNGWLWDHACFHPETEKLGPL
jgi:hypothetical protein